MFCRNCGQKATHDGKFCAYCGAPGESDLPEPVGQTNLQSPDRALTGAAGRPSIMAKNFGMVLLVVVSAWLGFHYYTSQPEYSLMQLKAAIDHHDLAMFEKYVDTNSLVSNAVDQTMSWALKEGIGSSSNDSAEGIGAIIGIGIADNFKPQIVSAVLSQLNNFVEKGSLDQKDGTRRDVSGLKDFRLQGKPQVRRDADTAYVTLPLVRDTPKFAANVELKLRKKDSYWQVTEIRNWSDVLDQIRKSASEDASSKQPTGQPEDQQQIQQAELAAPPTNQQIEEPQNASMAPAASGPPTDVAPTTTPNDHSLSEEHKSGSEYEACAKQADSVQGSNSYTFAMKDCAAEETARQDDRLNRTWTALIRRLSTPGLESEKKTLITEERSWIQKKENDCVIEDDGSASRLKAQDCVLEMTRDQADKLEAKLNAIR